MMNPWQMINSIRSNPAKAMQGLGYNLPADLRSPQEIVKHLLNSGQISQDQINNAQIIARRMGFRF